MNVPDLNFGDLFDELARVIPDRPAILCGDRQLDWRVFDERSNRLARRLIDAGLAPGSKVAFYLRNSPAYLELFAACAKALPMRTSITSTWMQSCTTYWITPTRKRWSTMVNLLRM